MDRTKVKDRFTRVLSLDDVMSYHFVDTVGRQRIVFLLCNDWVEISYIRSHPSKHHDAVQKTSPFKVDLLGTIHAPQSCESYLHERFSKERGLGKWFHLSEDLLAFIRKYVTDNRLLYGYRVPKKYVLR